MPKWSVLVELRSHVDKIVEAETYDEAVEEAIADTDLDDCDGFTADAISCFCIDEE